MRDIPNIRGMKMKKVKLITGLISIVLILSLATPVFAGPPPDNPGKGPPEVGKMVFIHYKKGAAPVKPEGKPEKGPKGKDEPYSYSGIHWMDLFTPVTVDYLISYIGQRGNGVTLLDTKDGVTAAFKTWEDDPRSSIVFNWAGWTDSLPDTYDGYNVVGWGDLSQYPGAIAVTVVWYLLGTGWILDCDVVLNNESSLMWTQADIGNSDPDTQVIDGPGYDVDIQNIMTHESGHWLQLNDLYEEVGMEQTMYGYASDGELKKRSLEDGDLAGIRYIYGQRGKKR